jgi:hypothetical protein
MALQASSFRAGRLPQIPHLIRQSCIQGTASDRKAHRDLFQLQAFGSEWTAAGIFDLKMPSLSLEWQVGFQFGTSSFETQTGINGRSLPP